MIDQLKTIMEKEGLSASQLADKLNVQRSGLSHILSGRNNPSFDFVKKILIAFPNYNADWVIFGDTNVNSIVDKSKQPKELSLFDEEDKAHAFSEISEKKKREFLPKQVIKPILKQQTEKTETTLNTKNKKLTKILMIYDDGTFEEAHSAR